MMKPETIALELLEYKLNDIQAQRPVAGGVESVWDLFSYLSGSEVTLSAAERHRVTEAGETLKRLTAPAVAAPKTAHDTFEALVIESFGDITQTAAQAMRNDGAAADFREAGFDMAAVSANLSAGLSAAFGEPTSSLPPAPLSSNPLYVQEQKTLQRLAGNVWWFELESILQQLAVYCRVEKDRYTARLLYALLRNLERYSLVDDFVSDTTLTNFEVSVPVADHHDPLASLNNIETLTELVREVVTIIMTLGEPESHYPALQMPRTSAFSYLKEMALAIAQNPYAGKFSSVAPVGPTSEQLRFAIQELAREPVPLRADEQRRQRDELELRLRETVAQERRQKEFFTEDVGHFTAAVTTFFERLEPYLPKRVGGLAADPTLPGGVLFATNPALRLAAIPASATAVTVNIKGPIRFNLAGMEIAVMGAGHTRVIFVDEQEYLLQPRVKVNLGKRKLYSFLENDYLHLRIVDETRSLAVLLAEAQAVLYVLSAEQRDDILTVLRAATNVGLGDASRIVTEALERLTELTARAPKRRAALEGFTRGAMKATRISLSEGTVSSIVQRFHTAMTVTSDDFARVLAETGHTEVHVHALSADPLSLQIAGQPVTVRKYRRGKEQVASVVVMLPGRIVGSFSQRLLRPFPGGALLCVRSGDEFAALYYAGVVLDL